MISRKQILLFLILIFLCAGSFQPFGCNTTITGIVTDPQEQVIKGANVTIVDDFDTFTSSTTTNSSGEYTFENVPYGPYTITVTYDGYADTPSPIDTSYFETGITCKEIDGVNIQMGDIISGEWTTQSSGTSEMLFGVKFIDSNNGWVVGANGIILKTSNGGGTWSALTSGTTDWLVSVDFVDSNNGWIAGGKISNYGTILRTINGGDSWTISVDTRTAEIFMGVDFVDTNTGWAVGPYAIRHTTDGGNNWPEQTSEGNGHLRNVFFIDSNTGWACGTDGSIIKTTDGGDNWSLQIQTGNEDMIWKLCFIDYSNGWGVKGVNLSSSSIVNTTNGGTSWDLLTDEIDALIYVKFENLNSGFAVGDLGVVYRTNDGGNSWVTEDSATIDESTFNNIFKVFFINPDVGWAVCMDGTILKYTRE